MDLQRIACRIRRLRGDMSQSKFAQNVGLGQTYISEIELCKLKPSLEALYSISEFCRVSIDYILKGSFSMTPIFDMTMRTMIAEEAINHLGQCAQTIKKLDCVAFVGMEQIRKMEEEVIELEMDSDLIEALHIVKLEGRIAN